MRDPISNSNSNRKYRLSRIVQYVIQKLFSIFYENVFIHTSCLYTPTLKYLILYLLIKRLRKAFGVCNDIPISVEI